jgi:hypothetical protein
MNTIEQAIRDVAEGHIKREAHPGKWRVFTEGRCVMFEDIALGKNPVVVTTMIDE